MIILLLNIVIRTLKVPGVSCLRKIIVTGAPLMLNEFLMGQVVLHLQNTGFVH